MERMEISYKNYISQLTHKLDLTEQLLEEKNKKLQEKDRLLQELFKKFQNKLI